MKTKKLLSILTIVLTVTSCSTPWNKESYLEKFDVFISEVSENYQSYSEKEWKKQTKKYDKLSGEWYKKFKNDLTVKDEIVIKANQAKWYYYRNLNSTTSTIKQLFQSFNESDMKKQIQYYVDNDMTDDLKLLYETAQQTGEKTEKAFVAILNELDVKLDVKVEKKAK